MKRILAFILWVIPSVLLAQGYTSTEPSQAVISSPNVSSIAEDAEGNIWIGTIRGLNRYNGSSYVVFYQEDNGLPDDSITAICPDSEGRLGVGTGSGISLIRDGRVDPGFRVRANRVSQVQDWDDGHLLYSTREGLFTADKATGASHPVYLDRRLLYNTFIVTPGRRIWIRNTSSSVITVLDQGFRVLREFHITDRDIAGMHVLPEGDVCIYTDNGTLCYDEDGTPVQTPPELAGGTDGKAVVLMCSHGNDTYVGVKGEGLFRLTHDGMQRQWEEEYLSDAGECIALLTEDNLWISKEGQAPTNFYRHKEEYTVRRPTEFDPDALNMFYLLGDGYILVVTNKVIFRQHIGSGSYRAIKGEGLLPIGFEFDCSKGHYSYNY